MKSCIFNKKNAVVLSRFFVNKNLLSLLIIVKAILSYPNEVISISKQAYYCFDIQEINQFINLALLQKRKLQTQKTENHFICRKRNERDFELTHQATLNLKIQLEIVYHHQNFLYTTAKLDLCKGCKGVETTSHHDLKKMNTSTKT